MLDAKTWSIAMTVQLLCFVDWSLHVFSLYRGFKLIIVIILKKKKIGSPVSRWASVAFGAGVGIGSAYTDCSRIFQGSPAKMECPKKTSSVHKELTPLNTPSVPASQVC
jgi:endonuclease/exonuclease/phosphatase (EEP) superfamily protein YafD